MALVYMPVKEAAALLRLSISTVYRRAKKGTLKCRRDGRLLQIAVEKPVEAASANNNAEQPVLQADAALAPAPTGGAQRELVITPRERIGGFYQVFFLS